METDSELYDMLMAEFNDDEQKLFIDNYMFCLKYDREKDFVIDLDDVYEYVGFSLKGNAKRLLESYFIENEHFSKDSLVLPRDKQSESNKDNKKISNRGGHNKIKYFMTPDTFRDFCLQAKTPQGQKVRKFYIKMVDVMNKYLQKKSEQKIFEQFSIEQQQYQQKLIEAENKLQNKDFALQSAQDDLARYKFRRVNKDEPGQCVYIYRESEFKYKIGESSNISRRESDHRSSTSQSMVVYTKRCCNSKLLERVVHHILDQYRDNRHREWFTVSFDIAKTVVDCAHMFLDGLVDRCNSIHKMPFFDQLNSLIETLPQTEAPMKVEENPISDVESDEEIIEDPIEIEVMKDPLDFDKFIEECCIKDPKATSFSVDIYGAHRLWGRCCMKTTHDALYKYLCLNFKKTQVFSSELNAKLSSYKGFTLKPISYNKPKTENDIDHFINECCDMSYCGRLSSKSMIEAFEKWKQQTIPDFKMITTEKTRINDGFRNRFLPSIVFTGKQSDHGFFGVTLKGDKSYVGYKLAPSLKKKVIKVNIKTKEIMEHYDSLTEAARKHNVSPGTMCSDIKFKKSYGEFFFQYIPKTVNPKA